MDRLRTLLLARTTTVVLDPDQIANAATRPSRDVDIDKFEDELAQLGYVMSLDLAMTVRRLPHQACQDLKAEIVATLSQVIGADRRTCWDGGNYAGCPICHRRIAVGDPFVRPGPDADPRDVVERGNTQLRIINLAFDPAAVARDRFERLLARTTPLSKQDREEVETVIDVMGPRAVTWFPKKIAVKETLALALARFWIAAPDRAAMVRATQNHLKTATDVLRIAVVLMGCDPALVEPMRLRSIPRSLRRAVLGALDKLPPEQLLEDMRRRVGLWKRVGERLHPFEIAHKLPNAALAFAAIRGTDLAAATFAGELETRASKISGAAIITKGSVKLLRVTPWAGAVEDALRAGDAKAAIEHLARRPGELLRRVDHLVRVATAKQPAAFDDVLSAIRTAMPGGAPNTLLVLGSHVRARTAPWPRRVMFPKGEVLKAWGMPDTRPPLRSDAIGSVVEGVRQELLARAEKRKHFARAVIDRGLADLLVPIGERSASPSKVAWPRGSETALPAGQMLRLFLHWEQPPTKCVDLDLSVAFFNRSWRHVKTCDFTNLVVGDRVAVHSGDLTDAPAPLGASEFVDLDLDGLHALGAAYAVMVVFSYNAVPFDRLTHGFAGLMLQPEGSSPFDPRAVVQKFDLSGASVITIPLTIDLEARRMRWVDVHLSGRGEQRRVGGHFATGVAAFRRAALAHIGRDFTDFVGTRARPTLWDVAAIHAAARANVIYVRELDGTISTIRRRDHESMLQRLARINNDYSLADANHDSQLSRIPHADAPTLIAVLRDDKLTIPKGSAAYILDARESHPDITRLAAADLIAELA